MARRRHTTPVGGSVLHRVIGGKAGMEPDYGTGPVGGKAAGTADYGPPAPPPPPSHSGGTSGDLSIPEWHNETPIDTTPYVPSEAPTAIQAGIRREQRQRRRSRLLQGLAALPPLTAPSFTSTPQSGNLLDLISPLGALPGAQAQTPLQKLLEGVGGALGGNPGGLLAALPGSPQAAAQAAGPAPAPPKPVLRKVSDIAENRINLLNDQIEAGDHSLIPRVNRLAAIASKPSSAPSSLLNRAEALVAETKPIGPGGTRPKQGLSYGEWNESLGLRNPTPREKYLWLDPNDKADPAHWQEKLNKLDHLRSRFGKQRVEAWIGGKGTLPVGHQGPTPGAPVTANPRDPLGAKTLGNVTGRQLAQAQRQGTLHVSKKGILTTPKGRSILRNVVDAHQAFVASRGFGPVKSGGQLTPEEIATLLIEEGRKQHAHLTVDEIAEGVGVAMAETGGESSENRQLGGGEHIGLFAESPAFGTVDERLEPRAATAAALGAPGGFLSSGRDWNPAWVHWQEVQGEEETGADRAPQYVDIAQQLIHGGHPDPQAAQNLQVAKQQARAAGINPTPWNGDVAGAAEPNFTWVRSDAKGMLDWATSALGTQQGDPRQVHWSAETAGVLDPWCAVFVSAGLKRRGIDPPANPNYSGAFMENWDGGKVIAGGDPYTANPAFLEKAKPGDILVINRSSDAETDHVGIYKGDGMMIGGNQSDSVSEIPVEADALVGVVRPNYQGGKVKVPDTGVPGSSPGSTYGTSTSTGTTSVPGSTPTEGLSAGTPTEPNAGGGSILQQQTPFAPLAPIAAPGFAAAGPANPDVSYEPGTMQSEEMLRLLTEPTRGAVLR